MNCKNCEYAIKCRSLQDNEWYTRCTYEEGECVKITELEAQIEKMRNCGNCVNICNGRRNDRCTGCMKSKNFRLYGKVVNEHQ